MKRLLSIATSRWIYVIFIVLGVIAVRIQSQALLLVLYLLAGAVVGTLLVAGAIYLMRLNGAWWNFPRTPKHNEYVHRKQTELSKNNKNRVNVKNRRQ